MRRFLLLAIFAALFGVDQWSKWLVQATIPLMQYSPPYFPYGGIPVLHDVMGINFSINFVVNKGAAWGIFSSYQEILMAARLVLIAGLFVYVLYFNREKSRQIPFALILAGAVGNVVDYFAYGHVVDMFHFQFGSYTYPVFNVADSAIFCGIVWLIIQSFLSKKCCVSQSG